MDPKERLSDPEEAFRSAVEGILAGLWTALPCIVNSVNAEAMTVTLQPTIMAKVRSQDGTLTDTKLPLLLDVPLIFQRGGALSVTMPVTKGDEAVAVFSSRCIDSWWQSGGIQTQAELRMHDLSDAFAFVGPYSQPNVLTGGFSTTSVQVRTNSLVIMDLSPTQATFNVPVVMTQTLAVTENTTIGGTLAVTGDITGDVVDLKTHTHSGVQTGSGNSGPPV